MQVCHHTGLRCYVHAIGAKAFDMALDTYQNAIGHSPRKDHAGVSTHRVIGPWIRCATSPPRHHGNCVGRALDSGRKDHRSRSLRHEHDHSLAGRFEQNDKSRMAIGKLTHIAVLAEDPFTIQPENIKELKVATTLVGGERKY